MPYLTKLEISHEIAGSRRLFDSYAWHKVAWECFPGMPDAKRDFLTRLDASKYLSRLYILSRKMPHKPDWCPEDCWADTAIPQKFLEQRHYRFDLRANPTRKIKKIVDGEPRKNGKRVALTKQEDQKAWILRKTETCGFTILEEPALMIEPAQNYRFIKRMEQAEPGLHVGVRYSGILEVKDFELFQKAYLDGIGSAKGFGFGLMLLKPVVL
jgi:CRISPR system Cascade subunit CasE